MSDKGWESVALIVTTLISAVSGAVSAYFAKRSNANAKRACEKSDDLMQQTMRAFLIQVFTGQLKMPLETFEELYAAYYRAGGNHEIREMAIDYLTKQGGVNE